MRRHDSRNHLDFKYNRIHNDDAGANAQPNNVVALNYRNRRHPFNGNSGAFQFPAQSGLLCELKQTRSGGGMNLNGKANDLFRQPLILVHGTTLWPSVVLGLLLSR
jgi:hypothetical protein